MALTLPEAAKLSTDVLQRGVIETYARNSAVLEMLPFMDIQGNSYRYNQEQTLPGVGFRSVNEAYEESTGVVNQLSEGLVIAGGDLDVDRFIVQTRGNVNDQRAIQTQMKVKALSLTWTDYFFNGDVATDPKGFDGLKKRLTGNQVLSAGTDGGNLTIMMLDELIDSVEGEPDVIYCNKAMRREIKALIQGHTGYSEGDFDAFGRKVMTYGGIPIRAVEENSTGTAILGFGETQGTASDTSSLYAVKFGPEQYVSGLQNGGIDVMDLGQLQEKPAYRTRVEWYNGMAVFHPRAAARLKGVKKKA
ncbi:phage major capsid protein [Sutcliffiella horikoshii]|uniref:Phage major capsid protein n=1 Tax=Sutcliffiella horikoshii TaxID=79883 RepID=A0A5D4SA05_9BACI|nr:phage major capsid protein [Sutcliffiella horikoshii]TYS60477.1 phage major capsid protein [Sutcliffiella horikoshii]